MPWRVVVQTQAAEEVGEAELRGLVLKKLEAESGG